MSDLPEDSSTHPHLISLDGGIQNAGFVQQDGRRGIQQDALHWNSSVLM
jgi:hypothetical protein